MYRGQNKRNLYYWLKLQANPNGPGGGSGGALWASPLLPAVLVGNNTFLTKNITQDRKRFIIQPKHDILIKLKVSESWWSAFVISAKKNCFSF